MLKKKNSHTFSPAETLPVWLWNISTSSWDHMVFSMWPHVKTVVKSHYFSVRYQKREKLSPFLFLFRPRSSKMVKKTSITHTDLLDVYSGPLVTAEIQHRLFSWYSRLMNLAKICHVEYSIESNPAIDWECMTRTLVMQCVLFFLAAKPTAAFSLSLETVASSLSLICFWLLWPTDKQKKM